MGKLTMDIGMANYLSNRYMLIHLDYTLFLTDNKSSFMKKLFQHLKELMDQDTKLSFWWTTHRATVHMQKMHYWLFK
jgi:hypothetical protein